MASVLAAYVSVSEVPALSTGSREPASVSRPASRPNLDGLGLGLGLGHPCLLLGLGLGLGGRGFVYRVSRTRLGYEAGLETEAGSRDLVEKGGTSETKTESWAPETETDP